MHVFVTRIWTDNYTTSLATCQGVDQTPNFLQTYRPLERILTWNALPHLLLLSLYGCMVLIEGALRLIIYPVVALNTNRFANSLKCRKGAQRQQYGALDLATALKSRSVEGMTSYDVAQHPMYGPLLVSLNDIGEGRGSSRLSKKKLGLAKRRLSFKATRRAKEKSDSNQTEESATIEEAVTSISPLFRQGTDDCRLLQPTLRQTPVEKGSSRRSSLINRKRTISFLPSKLFRDKAGIQLQIAEENLTLSNAVGDGTPSANLNRTARNSFGLKRSKGQDIELEALESVLIVSNDNTF